MLTVKSNLLSKFFVGTHILSAQKIHFSTVLKMTQSPSPNCIFCAICSGAQPTELLYEDEEMVVFKDIKPYAKYHYLAVSKSHIKDVKALTLDHKPLLEKLISIGKNVLQENGADVGDLRFGFHVPPFNSIQHLHLHLLSPASEMSFLGRMVFKPNTWWFVTSDYVLDNLPSPNKL